MSGIGRWIDRTVGKVEEALEEAGEAVVDAAEGAGRTIASGARRARDEVVGAARDVESWFDRLSEKAKLTLHHRSLAGNRPVTPEMDAFTRAATEKANRLKDLIRMPGLAGRALAARVSGGTKVTDEVLEVLKTCRTSAELDAVVSQVGRRPLIMRLNIVEGRDDGGRVKAYIDQVRRSDVKPGDWGAFERYLDQVTETRTRAGNQVTLLNGTEKAFPEIFKTIDGARESVNVETFNFADDGLGREYAGHLIAAAKRGVTVNVMMDGYATRGNDRLVAHLRENGVHVHVGKADYLADLVDHRKVLVVDGRTGFTGGMNITDHRAGWRDMHSKIEGPAVQDLQRAFLERWRLDSGSPASGGVNYLPPLSARGRQAVRIVPHTGDQDENIRLMYLRALDTATKSITIADAYFTDAEVMDHLMRAARRGVNVRVVMPGPNDEPTVAAQSRAHYGELIAAGVEVYEYQPSMAHQKVAVVDGKLATIGSSNLDARSLRNDHELNMVALDPGFAGELEAAIGADIAQSKRMTEENRASWDRPLNPLLRVMTFEDEV